MASELSRRQLLKLAAAVPAAAGFVRPEAEVEGVNAGLVLKRILESVPVPKEAQPAPAEPG